MQLPIQRADQLNQLSIRWLLLTAWLLVDLAEFEVVD